MSTALLVIALALALACPLRALLRLRRGGAPCALLRPEAPNELRARQRQLAKRVAGLDRRAAGTAARPD